MQSEPLKHWKLIQINQINTYRKQLEIPEVYEGQLTEMLI